MNLEIKIWNWKKVTVQSEILDDLLMFLKKVRIY